MLPNVFSGKIHRSFLEILQKFFKISGKLSKMSRNFARSQDFASFYFIFYFCNLFSSMSPTGLCRQKLKHALKVARKKDYFKLNLTDSNQLSHQLMLFSKLLSYHQYVSKSNSFELELSLAGHQLRPFQLIHSSVWLLIGGPASRTSSYAV